MIDATLIAGLLDLVRLASSGSVSVEAFARRLLEIAAATGIAPALLSEYLTAAGTQHAEIAGDITEEAKLAIKRMGG